MEQLLPQLVSYSEPVVVGLFALALLTLLALAWSPDDAWAAAQRFFPPKAEKAEEKGK